MATEKSREERNRKLFQTAQVLVLCFGVFLVLMGGIGSLSEERLEELHYKGKFISPTINHHYATAAHNLLLGQLFIVCSIGLYVPVFWARKATFVACIVYVANTVALTVWEHVVRMGRGQAFVFESFADIIFWSVVPVIIVALLLVSAAGEKKPSEATEEAA